MTHSPNNKVFKTNKSIRVNLVPNTGQGAIDWLELWDVRVGRRSTIVVSKSRNNHWKRRIHQAIKEML